MNTTLQILCTLNAEYILYLNLSPELIMRKTMPAFRYLHIYIHFSRHYISLSESDSITEMYKLYHKIYINLTIITLLDTLKALQNMLCIKQN